MVTYSKYTKALTSEICFWLQAFRGGVTSCKVKVAHDTLYAVQVTAYSVIGPGTASTSLSVTTPPAVAVPVKP